MILQPEHRLQSWADRFIDRVVLAPSFITGIDHAGKTTDNARARMAARGVKFGISDHYILQGEPTVSAWCEFKHGSGKATDRQEGVMQAIGACGVHTFVARSIYDVLRGLRVAGFRLHQNADNLAAEFQARLEAAEAPSRPATAKPRRAKARVSASDIRRVEAARSRVLF